MNKLQDIGISPFGITWFNSYFSERHRVVRLNNELSERLPVESGVSQSSVQGPILLSIYVNDLSSISPFEWKTGQNLYLILMVISSRFLIGASIIVFFWTEIRRSLCYKEVAEYCPTSLTSIFLCWGIISYLQKPLKILALHLNLTFYDHILKSVSSCAPSLA